MPVRTLSLSYQSHEYLVFDFWIVQSRKKKAVSDRNDLKISMFQFVMISRWQSNLFGDFIIQEVWYMIFIEMVSYSLQWSVQIAEIFY